MELIFPHGVLDIEGLEVGGDLDITDGIEFVGEGGDLKEGNGEVDEMEELVDRVKVLLVVGLVDFFLELILSSK